MNKPTVKLSKQDRARYMRAVRHEMAKHATAEQAKAAAMKFILETL